MKIFLDTNVCLSATIFPGLCEELLLQCSERHSLLSSVLIQTEAHEVLLRKFPQVPSACAWFDATWQDAILIPDVTEPADDNDQRLVNAAVAADADLFVTGDKRVLSWQSVKRAGGSMMQIESPREAWGVLFA